MNKSEIAEIAGRIEKILFRRALENKLVGYTLETSLEIERAIAESRGQANDYFSLRKHLNDYESIFYGPHMCPCGDTYIVRRALAQGGQMYRVANYEIHECPKVELGDGEPSSAPPAKESCIRFICRHGTFPNPCEICQGTFTNSGAAQEVSPPSPEHCYCVCHLPTSSCPSCVHCWGDTRELKAALKCGIAAVRTASSDNPDWVRLKMQFLIEAERLLGEPTKE